MRGLVLLGVMGAGAYWAYKQGYLPQLGPVVEAVQPYLSRAAHILPQSEWDAPTRAKAQQVKAIKQASGGQVVPILGQSEVVAVNPYEGLLRKEWINVSGWARRNIGWASAILKVENGALNPTISGDGGTSHGVGQVKVATAETCYRAGYTRFKPTRETLLTYSGGVYFATAEMERLAGINSDLDWIIQAYNGGAGWQQMDAGYQRDRAAYLQRVKAAFTGLYGGAMV